MSEPLIKPEQPGQAAEPVRAKPAEALVRCKGFRCAAYRDKGGVWRSVADDAELEVLEVLVRF